VFVQSRQNDTVFAAEFGAVTPEEKKMAKQVIKTSTSVDWFLSPPFVQCRPLRLFKKKLKNRQKATEQIL
jgi:hypothetical protein